MSTTADHLVWEERAVTYPQHWRAWRARGDARLQITFDRKHARYLPTVLNADGSIHIQGALVSTFQRAEAQILVWLPQLQSQDADDRQAERKGWLRVAAVTATYALIGAGVAAFAWGMLAAIVAAAHSVGIG
jgi:hypothetical protein